MIFKNIQLLMMSRGMKKIDLAKAVGMSSGNLSDWANGKTSPSVDKLIKIADYFGVSLDYIAGRNDFCCQISPDARELSKIYDSLDKEGRAIVLGQAYTQKQRVQAMMEKEETMNILENEKTEG